MRAARRCGRGFALARRAPRSCAYYTRHERVGFGRGASRRLLGPPRRVRDRCARHRARAADLTSDRRGAARRSCAERRRVFHLCVRGRVSDGSARDRGPDDRQARDACARGGARRRRVAAGRLVPACGRLLGRARAHARDRPDHRRAAQGQAGASRPRGGQPRRASSKPDGGRARGARGSADGRRALDAAAHNARVIWATARIGTALDRVIRTLPLPLRNRLAATILEAVADVHARQVLATVAESPMTWLSADQAQWAPVLAARARRASAALAALPPMERHGLDAVLDVAARLYDAALYFEVHEWLEPHWVTASGPTRETLQGLIQTAVGWQHLANDNVAGARSLLTEGAARLRGQRLGARDLDAFGRATAMAATGLPASAPPPFPERQCDAREREESV